MPGPAGVVRLVSGCAAAWLLVTTPCPGTWRCASARRRAWSRWWLSFPAH